METKLARIAQSSRENPDMMFTSIGHLINKEMLKGYHGKMGGAKAVGIDEITKEALKEILEAVFEPHFFDEMMGFRPGRSCHMAIRKLNGMLEKNWTR